MDFAPALDRLSLETVLAGFDGSEAALAQFVRIVPTVDNRGGRLQVDADGGGAAVGWLDLAVVQGQAKLAALALWRVGDLLIDDQHPAVPFDPLGYIASYGDLIEAFGADALAGKRHYLVAGFAEQREVSFNGLEYIASYPDLIAAFGPDRNAGSTHFITNGYAEQRSVSFDGLQYIASYDDLIVAFRAERDAGSGHFIINGLAEGRQRDDFDEVQYVANYADLQAAFGTDYEAATIHFIEYGYDEEGRTSRSFP